MRIFLLLLALVLASPGAYAAAPGAKAPQQAEKAQQPEAKAPDKTASADKADKADKGDNAADADKAAPALGKGAAENEYISPYYTVALPEGWKAVMPPHEQQGNISAIFATNTNATVVTMIVGPNDGADARTIAGMFAEQFKAKGKPTERNGQFTFKFQMQNGDAQAFVATQGAKFMVTAVSGNLRQGQDFLRKAVASADWRDLLPKW